MTTTIRRATMACGAAVLGLIAATAGAAPAQAAARNGICESGEFCYYYNSYNQGSVSDFTASVADYGTSQPDCYEFKGPGAGQYQCIKNNAASVWNRSTVTVRVYYNSNYGGTYMDVTPGYKGQLSTALYNQNASHKFGTGGLTGAVAAARAQVWVDNDVSYSQTSTYQGYRKDCSGYLSMAWGLSTPGLTTWTLPNVGYYIDKSQLRQGDALLAVDSHVTMFDHWADSTRTSYWGYEETPSVGATFRKIPYPYWSGYGTFKPFRYRGLS